MGKITESGFWNGGGLRRFLHPPSPALHSAAFRGEVVTSLTSGSGGDAVEAIADLLSIARLPPGHDPGAGYGVATAARHRWHLAIRHFGLLGGPLAAAND